MSKRKKRRNRATEKDAAPDETPPAENATQSDNPANNGPNNAASVLTVHRVVLVIAATLWAGWFGFLLYIALMRG